MVGHAGRIDHSEVLTSDRHGLYELPPNAGALAGEVPSVSLAPERQGPVTFAFGGGELGAELLEGQDLDGLGLDNAKWFSGPVGDDA